MNLKKFNGRERRDCLESAAALLVLAAAVAALAGRGQGWRTPAFWAALGALAVLAWGTAARQKRTRLFLSRLAALAHGAQLSDEESAPNPRQGWNAVELLEQLENRLAESATAGALKTEAELHALQNQINPHFLYNTLEIIRSRALIQGNHDVAEMVESLALQFRYCINSQGELATLQQELDHVHNYLLIQRYRFGDRIRYKEIIHDPEERVMNSKIPMLTLQPIIENALIHGVNPRVEGGCITLRVRASEKRLYLSVEDDGVGIAEEEVKKMRRALQENAAVPLAREQEKHSSGIAMRNVNQRIRLYFGQGYGVDISSTSGVGTSVFITLPRIYMD